MKHERRPRLAKGLQPLSMAASLAQKRNENFDVAMDFELMRRFHQPLTITVKDNIS
jgi:hypothetical protein